MIYKDTLDYLFSQLPMYQRSGAAAYKEDIGNIWTNDKFNYFRENFRDTCGSCDLWTIDQVDKN